LPIKSRDLLLSQLTLPQSLRAAPPRTRRPVGGGLSPCPLQGLPAAPRRRAPARGVDVKQPPAGRPGGAGRPRKGPGRLRGARGPGFQDPGSRRIPIPAWAGGGLWARGPGQDQLRGPGSRDRPCPRTGFYINPSRRGPVPGRDGVRNRRSRGTGLGAPEGSKKPFFSTPAKSGYRAPPRGVDVKPPPPRGPGSWNRGFLAILRIFPKIRLLTPF